MGKIYTIENKNSFDNAVKACVEALNNGGLAVFPTETVYGIGANAFDENALNNLYIKKQRPFDKPLLMHISSLEMAEEIAVLDDTSRELIKKFAPGPLTLVVKRKNILPSVGVAGGDTVGLRFPSNDVFLAVSKAFNKPIAATSANISGLKSAVRTEELKNVMPLADVVIDGGECELGLESTIVSMVDNKPKILRVGSFPKEKLAEVIDLCN